MRILRARQPPVTNGEYLRFMEAGGYTRSEFWLSLGWTTVQEQRWEAPLYWEQTRRRLVEFHSLRFSTRR